MTRTDAQAPSPGSGSDDVLADGAVSVSAAVKFSGLGRSTLYEAMQRGQLAYTTHGRRRLIPRRALTRFLARNLIQPTTGATV
jgi:excisionase family DNA binding protein